jgi:seryl-tRNA synthetase
MGDEIYDLEQAYGAHILKLDEFYRLRKQTTKELERTLTNLTDQLGIVQNDLEGKIASNTASSTELTAEIDMLKAKLTDVDTGLEIATTKVKDELMAFEQFDKDHAPKMNIDGGKRMKRRSRRFGRERKSRRK